HGLVTWGETSKESYDQTISIIQEAEDNIENKAKGQTLFGGQKYETLSEDERKETLAQIMPIVRGQVSVDKKMIVTYDDSEDVLSFINSHNAKELSQVGAACPDYLVHTKRAPLYVEWDPTTKDVDQLKELIKTSIASFKEEYISYFDRNKSEGDQIAETAPHVLLIPGIGMINTGKCWSAANVSESLYHRVFFVMRDSTMLGHIVSLNVVVSILYDIWSLDLY